MIDQELLKKIIHECTLDDFYNDYHGISHWSRVALIGEYLAKKVSVDENVVNIFAYIHDAKRLPSGHNNINHGEKAANLAMMLYSHGALDVSRDQLDQLTFACQHHSDGFITSDDITIQACWDSDRLDMWRINMIPDPAYLQTTAAKTEEAITFARELNRR